MRLIYHKAFLKAYRPSFFLFLFLIKEPFQDFFIRESGRPVFRNGTADYPHEGSEDGIGKFAPGNPAMLAQLILKETTKELTFCPLTSLESDVEFNAFPEENPRTIWGTYAWLGELASKSEDPWNNVYRDNYNRNKDAFSNWNINVTEEAEGMMMYDQNKLGGYYKTVFEHYSVLMRDGTVREPAKTGIKFKVWKTGITD